MSECIVVTTIKDGTILEHQVFDVEHSADEARTIQKAQDFFIGKIKEVAESEMSEDRRHEILAECHYSVGGHEFHLIWSGLWE